MTGKPRGVRKLLHVSCGPKTQANTHPTFHDPKQWAETRLDIDPNARPDIGAVLYNKWFKTLAADDEPAPAKPANDAPADSPQAE